MTTLRIRDGAVRASLFPRAGVASDMPSGAASSEPGIGHPDRDAYAASCRPAYRIVELGELIADSSALRYLLGGGLVLR